MGEQEYLQDENKLRDATIGKLQNMGGGMKRMIGQFQKLWKSINEESNIFNRLL